MTAKLTARERVHQAAIAAGWAPYAKASPGTIEYRNGRRYLWIYTSVTGSIIGGGHGRTGATGGRNLQGRGKAEQALAALAR